MTEEEQCKHCKSNIFYVLANIKGNLFYYCADCHRLHKQDSEQKYSIIKIIGERIE